VREVYLYNYGDAAVTGTLARDYDLVMNGQNGANRLGDVGRHLSCPMHKTDFHGNSNSIQPVGYDWTASNFALAIRPIQIAVYQTE